MYVYIETERVESEDEFTRVNYTVGFFDPSGRWRLESADHGSPEEAARRVAWLNGNLTEHPAGE
ncbi:hypothetical protein PQQ86_29545 [Paraburkholderia sediminicola]|uniref:hypothetical protein n=1 Tax=Paraburkholderia sediminicola TaxID=458836 RepID=UPI0038BC658D